MAMINLKTAQFNDILDELLNIIENYIFCFLTSEQISLIIGMNEI